MKKSFIAGALLLIAGTFSQAQAGSTPAKVEWVWINPAGSGDFAFKLVGLATAITVDANPATNPKVLAMLLAAKSADMIVVADYTAAFHLTAFRYN